MTIINSPLMMVLAWSVANFFENYEYFQAVTKQLFSFNFI